MARREDCGNIYNIFTEFMDRCLVNDDSLLWPGERIWTLENLEAIKRDFVDSPDTGQGDYWTKLATQFENLDDSCWRVLAEAHLLYSLPSNRIKPQNKYKLISTACSERGIELRPFDDPYWGFLHEGFRKTGSGYHRKYSQLWLLFLFALHVKKQTDRESFLKDHRKVEQCLDGILEEIPNRKDRAWDMRHLVLHMAYPDVYEAIMSTRDKDKIAGAFASKVPPELKNATYDTKILAIRKSFEEAEYKDQDFDFYLPNIKRLWSTPGGNGDDPDEDPLLGDMVRALRRRLQIILYGPPGTGKTYYALKLAREVIAQDNFYKSYEELDETEKTTCQAGNGGDGDGGYLGFCTFHPTFGYEEFIEGYRPRLTEGGIPGFVLQDGIFKRLCKKASSNPEKTYVLIIDEINRGNIPRIFGELITLVEKDKRRKVGGEGLSLTLAVSGETFWVPDNLLIVGTMNTADRSIALLDIALRRRFGFCELMPFYELLEGIQVEGIDLGKLLRELNKRVTQIAGRNLQVGHAYFLENEKPIAGGKELSYKFKDEILPLLQEYCYDDYEKLETILGRIVDAKEKTFDEKLFSEKGRQKLFALLQEMIGVHEPV